MLLPHERHDAHLLLELVLDRGLLRLGCTFGQLVHHALGLAALEFGSGNVRRHRSNLPIHRGVQVLHGLCRVRQLLHTALDLYDVHFGISPMFLNSEIIVAEFFR